MSLPHYKLSTFSMENFEPVYLNLYEVEFNCYIIKNLIEQDCYWTDNLKNVKFSTAKDKQVTIEIDEYEEHNSSFLLSKKLELAEFLKIGDVVLRQHNRQGDIFQIIYLSDVRIQNVKLDEFDYSNGNTTSILHLDCSYKELSLTKNKKDELH